MTQSYDILTGCMIMFGIISLMISIVVTKPEIAILGCFGLGVSIIMMLIRSELIALDKRLEDGNKDD